MSARKPVLPAATELLPPPGRDEDGDQARAELRAAEAVIRAARQVHPGHDYNLTTGNHVAATDCRGCRLERALARLDRVTRGSK